MRDRRTRLALALAAVGLVAAGAMFAAGGSSNRSTAKVAVRSSDGDMPVALAKHLAQLQQAIPGKGGEPAGESAGAPGQLDRQPGGVRPDGVSEQGRPAIEPQGSAQCVPNCQGANSGGRSGEQSRGVGTGRAGHGALPVHTVPGPPVRTSLRSTRPPGAPTDLAIDPNCGSHQAWGGRRHGGRCRMWITPAGGGVWRTDQRAGAATRNWKFLSGSFGINAVGSIEIDPNDPSSNTLWVGTGEGNTCGSGCVAGVGLYKSTDGGEPLVRAVRLLGVQLARRRHRPGSSPAIRTRSMRARRLPCAGIRPCAVATAASASTGR